MRRNNNPTKMATATKTTTLAVSSGTPPDPCSTFITAENISGTTVYITAVQAAGGTTTEVLALPPSTWNGMTTSRELIAGFAIALSANAAPDDVLFCAFNNGTASSFANGGSQCTSGPANPNPLSENGARAVFTRTLSSGSTITATVGYINSYPWRITVAVAPAAAAAAPWKIVGIVFIVVAVLLAAALATVSVLRAKPAPLIAPKLT